MQQLEGIFSQLGLNKGNGLFILHENTWKQELTFPNRIKRLLENKIIPQAFFCLDNKPLVLFFYNPANKQELYKAIWNFNESPLIFIVENDSVEIFNGFKYDNDLDSLAKIGGKEKLDNFRYFELVTGNVWEDYKSDWGYKNRVDYYLLNNIEAARKLLIETLDSKTTNALIGKCIFVRYLIDRQVRLSFNCTLHEWTNAEFCELLRTPSETLAFFKYLESKETGFNGDLFPISSEEYQKIEQKHFDVLIRLLSSEEIGTGQPSLFNLYDFSIIPIEFISNVYELFIGQDGQKKESAYYTPLFLVDYILKETVEKHLSKIVKEDLIRRITLADIPPKHDGYAYCKVLDSACGSGIFLVETLRKIIEKYISDKNPDISSLAFKEVIKRLAKENIYGVDKDSSAVQVAIFSVYLTLLDYLNPPQIEDFKFPLLLDTNFFQADFFDETHSFNDKLKATDFHFILGNPPWKRGQNEDKPLYVEYVLSRNKKEKGKTPFPVEIGNREIAQAFLLRTSDFSTVNTKAALIVTSKVLYNLKSIGFRKYFLHHFNIERIFELASVRYEVFDKSNDSAVAPACVLFYNYSNGENTDGQLIEHIALKPSRFFSMFKIFTLHRADFKLVQQSKLKEFDWLWKVLVYGSYLDFNFIKRLKDGYMTIKDLVSDKNRFYEGTGIQYSDDLKNKPIDASSLYDYPFVDAHAISKFFILPEKISLFKKTSVHRIRNPKLFEPPMLLIRKGLDMKDLTSYCAVSNNKAIFKDSVTSIAATEKNDIKYLRNIGAILISDLFSYYACNTFSSIGIEREQTQSDNKYSLPYFDIDLEKNVESIETFNQRIYLEKQKATEDSYVIHKLENGIEREFKIINNTIFETLKMSSVECDLIDYTLEINKILITGDEFNRNKLFEALILKDTILEQYATLYVNRFKPSLDSGSEKFVVEIWYTEQIIGMLFKTIHTSEYNEPIIWINKQDDPEGILSFLIKLSSEKITDRLFIQKDIRGFETDYFYIFKPNEKRLWHKAIGHLDVNEFADAILKAGRDAG